MAIEVRSGETRQASWAGGTCVGRTRERNEDAFGVFERGEVFVVADGCGGRSSGRTAADLALSCFDDMGVGGDGLPDEPLAAAMARAQRLLLQDACSLPEHRGQGCTLAALRLCSGWAAAAHVGDCRVGRLRQRILPGGPDLVWLTEDHALWVELLRAGASWEDVGRAREVHGTVVTQALGVTDELAIDVQYEPLGPGNLFRQEVAQACGGRYGPPMAQRMTLDEIERAYPQEWIVATDFVADDSVLLKEGVVVFHSPDRLAALDALGTVGQRAAFWYVGRPEGPFSGTLSFLK